VEFEYDNKNILYVRNDRKRKFFGSVFLRALGYKSDEQILRGFYRATRIAIKDNKLFWNVDDGLIGLKLSFAIAARGGETVVTQGKKITPSLYKEIQKAKIQQVEVASNDLEGAYVVADVFDTATGEVYADANSEITATLLSRLMESGVPEFEVFFPERDEVGTVISATIKKDPVKAQNEALIEIYRKLRPGDPPTLDTATQLFQGMFFDPRKYDFSRVGRMKFNIKLHENADFAPSSWLADPVSKGKSPMDRRTLDQDDFRDTIKYLLKLRRFASMPGSGYDVDDIDHLGNRRGRTARKPVPHRPGAHGARHQGEDVGLPGDVHGHAARLGERQAGDGGHPRVLRIQPVVPVHGPDQPALRDHAQAASLGARSGRPQPRARRI
jgi:DNA-directed RNA polymerase subunit beta